MSVIPKLNKFYTFVHIVGFTTETISDKVTIENQDQNKTSIQCQNTKRKQENLTLFEQLMPQQAILVQKQCITLIIEDLTACTLTLLTLILLTWRIW
jgi:hypothetical protein